MAIERPPVELRLGAIFARGFRVERQLLAGGNEVCVARQLSTGRHLALKVMHPGYSASDAFRTTFGRLPEISARMKSEHAVRVVCSGFDEQTGACWVAMELLRGEDLDGYIKRNGPVPLSMGIEILEQLGDVLCEAHAQGMVHSDLKLNSLFLAVPGKGRVPFTLELRELAIANAIVRFQLEQMGKQRLMGGIRGMRWLVPEWGESVASLPATDVWPLGLLAFYLLTGRIFWNADRSESSSSWWVEVLADPIPRASERAAELARIGARPLPDGFDDWFAACVDRDPRRRFADARAAMAALRPLLAAAGNSSAALAEAPPILRSTW